MIRASRLAVALMLCASLGACAHHRRGRIPSQRVAPSKLTQIGVNAYLWRAALDTLSFMTIAHTDSNGGVIATEWYVNPQVPTERMKVSVSILDQDLRADAVRVAAARQVLQNGQWVDAAVQAATDAKLEEIILQKARDLRRNAAG
jgi:alpha-beta hydrolase superfamily lysophospholipase